MLNTKIWVNIFKNILDYNNTSVNFYRKIKN